MTSGRTDKPKSGHHRSYDHRQKSHCGIALAQILDGDHFEDSMLVFRHIGHCLRPNPRRKNWPWCPIIWWISWNPVKFL